jgi:DNA replication protein DnaC
VRERFERLAEQACQEDMSYEAYLLALCQSECEIRRHNRIERLLRDSRIPGGKSLEALDLKRFGRKVALQVRALTDGGFVDRCENILAFGNPGSGKTHLLCAIGQELIQAGRRVHFTPSSLLVQQLLRAKQELKLDRLIHHSVILELNITSYRMEQATNGRKEKDEKKE